MAAHRKRRKFIPLALVLCVLMAAAIGGYALAGNGAAETVNLASASGVAGQNATVYACLASGKLSQVSTTAAPTCPAASTPVHWAGQIGGSGATGAYTTVYACLASGALTSVSATAAPTCPAKSAGVHWAVRASGLNATIYGCLTSGTLTSVSATAVPTCATSPRIHWAAQSGTVASPSPTPTTASPSPTPTKTTASPSPTPTKTTASPSPTPTTASPTPTPTTTTPASWAWCSSAPLGQWTVPDGRFDLYNNEWNSSYNPGPQTICGNNESDWQAVSNQRAGNTAVLTAPQVQIPYNDSNGYPLSDFSTLSSSYTEDMHAVAGTDAEAMYDLWLNGLNKEVMFWVDDHGQTPSGSVVATTTFSGATWDLWQTGSGYWAFVRQGNASSGTVDILAGLQFLESRGQLSATDKLWQVNFGWEICSTAGAPETFTVSNYSVSSSPSS